MRFVQLLLHDLFGIWCVAPLAALLPARPRRRLLWAASGIHRFHPDIDQAETTFRVCWPERSFDRRVFRFTILAEASSAWRIGLGRAPEFDREPEWPVQPGFVAAGAHFGNGIAVIWSLHRAGLKPRFLLRPPNRAWILRRPAGYLWSQVRQRILRRLCPHGVIHTGGARSHLEAALRDGNTTPVVLFDTPAEPGHSDWIARIGQCSLAFPTGARDLARQHRIPVVVFAPEIEPQTGRTRLTLTHLSSEEFIAIWPTWIARHIERRPGQWHLWHAVKQHLVAR